MSETRTKDDPETKRSGETFVEVDGLRKYFDVGGVLSEDPVKAVDGVSLSIDRGETLGLVGESGCGKTTLGRTMIRIETPTAGKLRFDGTDIAQMGGGQLREWQRNVGMVFQDPQESLNDRMTVGQIIRDPMDAHDWRTPDEREERVFDLLDKVGLGEEHYARYPHQFSGGQRQRVGIARALALEPDFVVLDEPTSALDVSVQARIINLLEDLQAEMDLTYLFITHDLGVVRHIADRIAVMYLGNIVERGPTESVFDDPNHPYTASLLSAIPGSDVKSPITGGERITLKGTPPSPRHPPSGCPFSTRCPAKIRPDEHDLSPEAWAAVEAFRTVLRERAQADPGTIEQIGRLLGIREAEDVHEIAEELFGSVTLEGAPDQAVQEAVSMAAAGNNRAAEQRLKETLGSACDEEVPEDHHLGEGRTSRCLRHKAEYREPQPVLDERESRL